MDKTVQNFDTQQAFIEIGNGGEDLNIYNINTREKAYEDFDNYFNLNNKRIQQDFNTDENVFLSITKSQASCKIDDIEAFTFGGFSSRFWAMRKHINCLQPEQLLLLPFHSWQCLSLRTKDRELNLVIHDQEQMNNLLKFLIVKL